MRLDKFLEQSSIGKRKDVRIYIKDGLVKVNKKTITIPAIEIDEQNDYIEYNGEKVEYKEKLYYMFNKPKGCVTAKSDLEHKTVFDYLGDETAGVFHVGRLDKDTEGLLLFTNDGEFEHKIMYPDKHVKKTYFFIALGNLVENEKEKLEEGVYINNGEYLTKPSKLEAIYNFTYLDVEEDFKNKYINHLEYNFFNQKLVKGNITISEGKKHQIKKMLKSVGCKVIYLKRISIGNLKLDDRLELGEYRNLTEEEKNNIFK